MAKLTEEKVMEMLNISSFKDFPKEKFKDFIALFPQMDPEIQMKALEQFPELISSAKDYLSVLKENTNEVLRSGEKISEMVCNACQKEIDCLNEMLNKEQLSREEKKDIFEAIFKIQQRLFEESDKHRRFADDLHKRTIEAGFATIVLAAVAIGVKAVGPRGL